MLGLAVPGMVLRNPACVRKTFPNFFAKLAEVGATVSCGAISCQIHEASKSRSKPNSDRFRFRKLSFTAHRPGNVGPRRERMFSSTAA